MDGSGLAAVMVTILVVGAFGFFLPGCMLVYAIQDSNYKAATVFIIWISISITIVVAMVRWLLKDPARAVKKNLNKKEE